MSEELPEGWSEVQLSDVAEMCLGKMLDQKKTAGTLLPYLGNINVRWGKFETTGLKTMPFENSQIDRYSVRKGDLVVCEGGEPGRCAIWNSVEPVMFQKALHRVRSGPALATSYLQRRLSLDVQIGKLDDLYTGTTIKHLTGASLSKYSFPLPPLNEQKRIVAKIDALTSRSREARQALDEVPALLDKLRQSILAAAFRGDLTKKWREQTRDVEPASALLERIRKERRRKWEEAELAKFKSKGKVPADDKWKAKYKEPEPVDTEGLPELPEGWCWASVEELIVDPLANGRSVPTREDGFPVLRLTALRDGKIDLSERKGGDWTEEQAAQFLVRDGDFLVSRGNGSLERVALGGHVRDADPVAFPDTLVRIRPSQSLTDNYFATVWASPGVRGQVEKKAKTTAGIHKVSQGDLGSIVIPVAPQGEQTAIVQVAGAGLDHSVNLRLLASALLESVPTLDASILTKAFRGELVPQDPNDEPASILLERIRKEREGGVANRTRTTAKRRKKDG